MDRAHDPDQPLRGCRVLDLTRVLSGPYCTMILGDHGADVIKVERPGAGDDSRSWGPPFVGGESAYFLCCNRNKRSIAVDLSRDEGVAVIRDLARCADVLVENFRPGFLQRRGLDHAALRAVNPRLVYCSISAYGQDGPYRDRPGYDMVLEAVGGLMEITGEPGGPPCKVGVAITDVLTGVHAACAITTALLWRERSGRGQHIDCSLLDVQVAALANIASSYLVAGEPARRWGTAHASIVPYQVFATRDRPLALAVANDKLWRRLCRLLGRDDWLADPRFRTNAARVQHRDDLVPQLAALLATRGCDDWLERLVAAGIPCGPVNDLARVFADPQVRHRQLVAEVEHPTAGALRLVGPPVRFSATPGAVRRPPPRLGEHTDEVLAEVLGCDAAQIAALRRDGAVA